MTLRERIETQGERAPLYTMSDEELQHYAQHGTDQERNTAETLLVNRWHQRNNPAAFTPPDTLTSR